MVWSQQDLVSRFPAPTCLSFFALVFSCCEVEDIMFFKGLLLSGVRWPARGGPMVKIFFSAGLVHILSGAHLQSRSCLSLREKSLVWYRPNSALRCRFGRVFLRGRFFREVGVAAG
jgi:hypothetical protein